MYKDHKCLCPSFYYKHARELLFLLASAITATEAVTIYLEMHEDSHLLSALMTH